MTLVELLGTAVPLGAGATALMDAWLLILKRRGVRTLDVALVGRWVGHLAGGRFAHVAIAGARPLRGERALRRQPLAGDELAQRDRGDEPLGDLLAGRARLEGGERAGELPDLGEAHAPLPSQRTRKRASTRAPSAIEDRSTASSSPWIARTRGP